MSAGIENDESTMKPALLSDHVSAGRMSIGIVQEAPTQFDEPLYRYLAAETALDFVVYYFGAASSTTNEDPEIGRRVGWTTSGDRGYSAVFSQGAKPLQFGRRVIQAGHDLIVISGYNRPHALMTALLARINGTPAGLRSDNVLPRDGGRGRHWFIKSLLYPILYKLYTTGHPIGRQAGEYLAHFGFRAESLFIFPYGVDHRWFARESSAARAEIERLRASWGLPAKGQVVCGVMKFSEREDPITLVRAFKDAREQIPNLALLLIGDGPLKKDVESAAGDLLGKSIVLPGYQEYAKLPSAYAASDLFVHTARGAWEVSVGEALACGLPVITSDAVGSAQELIVPNQMGYTFKHQDAGDLAMAIVRALRDPKLIARAREQGLSSLEPWDYPATAERLTAAVQYAKRQRKSAFATATVQR